MSKTIDHAIEASIRSSCKQLRLPTVASRAKELALEATRSNKGHLAYLDALLEAEIEDRDERRRSRRMVEAKFPRLKRLGTQSTGSFSRVDARSLPRRASTAISV